MSETKPHIAKAFGNGAAFGACAFTLAGIASVFMGVPVLGFEGAAGAVLGPLAAGGLGIITFGPLAAAANVIVHTIPGLATLLGEEHTGYQGMGTRTLTRSKGANVNENLQFAKEAERDLYVADYLREQHEVHDVDYHDRLIDESIAMEEEMRQSMR